MAANNNTSVNPPILATRSVWIFARPLSGSGVFPASSMVAASHGHFPLCHWGVLVTELSIVDVKALISRDGGSSVTDDLKLGVMWELLRRPDNKTTVNKSNPFKVATIKQLWSTLSAQYIGRTLMIDEEVQSEGNSPIPWRR